MTKLRNSIKSYKKWRIYLLSSYITYYKNNYTFLKFSLKKGYRYTALSPKETD